MATLPENSSFDAGIYLIETIDPVQGGATGISNKQAIALANRTLWLRDQITAILATLLTIAGLDSPVFTGTPRGPTAAPGVDTDQLATLQFVHRNSGGIAVVDVAGNGNVVLTPDQWGCAIIIATGLLTGNINVIFPTRQDRWLVVNRTTGLFSITGKTAGGSGVKIAQGRSKGVYCDGVNILDEETDLITGWRTVTAATVAASGDKLVANISGGVFPITLPANPADGDVVQIKGNFKVSNLSVLRNGRLINGVAEDLILNRNNVTATLVYSASLNTWTV